MNIRLLFAFVLALTLGALTTQNAYAQDEGADEAAAEEAPAAMTGQAIFEEECTRCHNDNGDAQTRMGQRFEVAPFTQAHFAEIGAEGVKDSIVNGRENMDPLEGYDDAQIDLLVEYTMSLGE